MSDIVERLRGKEITHSNSPYGEIARQAADEIERLTKERDEARALVGNETTLLRIMTDIREASGLHARPMLSEIAGEIRRIRRERDEARNFIRSLIDMRSGKDWTRAVVRGAAADFMERATGRRDGLGLGDTTPAFVAKAAAKDAGFANLAAGAIDEIAGERRTCQSCGTSDGGGS